MDENQRRENIRVFESELGAVNRPGMDGLLRYIRGSDFYSAPASTKYHLNVEGGLLQHSLDVLAALRGFMIPVQDGEGQACSLQVAGVEVRRYPGDTLVVSALLHDLCKTYFYKPEYRNRKNASGQWEQVQAFSVEDRMPLGHGPKSAMIAGKYISLTNSELYAIWHHMGPTGGDYQAALTFEAAVRKEPLVMALYMADMYAAHVMEGHSGPVKPFDGGVVYHHTETPESDSAQGNGQLSQLFEDAPPLEDLSELAEE